MQVETLLLHAGFMRTLFTVTGAAVAASSSSGARAGGPASQLYNFANTFGDSMVLQRNAPLALWGTGDCSSGCTIVIQQGPNCVAKLCNASVSVSTTDSSVFEGTLPPMPPSGSQWMPSEPMTISLYSGSSFNSESSPLATLSDILVGDVVLVSGQSNVGISVNYSNQFNWTAQLENQAEADRVGTRLRLMAVGQGMQPTEQTQLTYEVPCKLPSAQCGCLRWARANATNIVGYSALGWYLGRALYAAQHEAVPIGIIQSDVPGTPIQVRTATIGLSLILSAACLTWLDSCVRVFVLEMDAQCNAR
jgi:sialate O-acetylesterase